MESPEHQLGEEWLRRMQLLPGYWPIGAASLPLFLAIPIALMSIQDGSSFVGRLPLPLALYEVYSAIMFVAQKGWASGPKDRQLKRERLVVLLYMGQCALGGILFSTLSIVFLLIELERLGARGLITQPVVTGYFVVVVVTLALSPTLSKSNLIKKLRPPTAVPKNADKRLYWKRLSAILFGNVILLAALRGSALYYLLIALYAVINSLLFLVVGLTALYELWVLAKQKA